MSYEVKSLGKIGPNLQRIFEEEVVGAIEALEGQANIPRGTHTARKHFKKIRALLRLGREGIGAAACQSENACFRDAGRRLRDLRDAQVLVKALDALRKRFFNEKHPALLAHARKLLVADEQRCLEHLAGGDTIRDILVTLRAAGARGREWDLKGFGWKETRRAIRRSYKRARAAGRKALDDASVANLHEWRKRVKDLWYHARLLRKACPGFMREFAHELEVLSEFLGDDHDLAALRDALWNRREVLKQARQLRAFLKMLEIRRNELIRAAFEIGQRLHADTPAVFARGLDERREDHRQSRRKTRKLAPRLATPARI